MLEQGEDDSERLRVLASCEEHHRRAYLPIADAEEPEHDSIFSEIWKALAPI